MTESMVGLHCFVELAYSKNFLGDYVLGALVFLNFASMKVVCRRIAPALLAIEKPIRILAGYVLTLYLLHQPVFLFWSAVLRGDPNGYGYWWATTALVAVSIAIIGNLTEQRRQGLRRWLEALFSRAAGFWTARRTAPSAGQ